VIDLVLVNPLCAGGPDAVSNMQWQMVHDARIKDRQEWAVCGKVKHGMKCPALPNLALA
jgi:hypothetical protein